MRLLAVLCLAALIPAVAGAAEAPALDVQVVAAQAGPRSNVALVLMVTGTGLDPSALPNDPEGCDGSGYTRTDDPQETGCYRIAATENGKPVGTLAYDLMLNRSTTAYLLLRYRSPAGPGAARALRLDLSFKLWDDVIRSRRPEAEIDLAKAPGFADPDNAWGPLYTFQDRRLNEIYDALMSRVAGDAELRQAIIQAERGWIAVKDADCAAPLAPTPQDADQCRTLHTVERIDQLAALQRSVAEARP